MIEYAYQDNGVSWISPYLLVRKAVFAGDILELHCEICDRDTGKITYQLFQIGVPEGYKHSSATPASTKDVLRAAYLKLVCHEIDELMRVDDEWQDPHINLIPSNNG